ncbi:MAG: tRNA 2-thiocytidine(32) synthetase TtcA, partial [Deltaproteobacteria bacterium]
MNMFYGREISTMMPNQSLFAGKINIIRPLAYIKEELIKQYALESGFPVVENPCPTAGTTKRTYIKNLLQELEIENKDIRDNIFKALYHVKEEYLAFRKS